MAKATKAKRGPGRPLGTGAGYRNVVRVLLTDGQLEELAAWQAANKAESQSDAARRLIIESLARSVANRLKFKAKL